MSQTGAVFTRLIHHAGLPAVALCALLGLEACSSDKPRTTTSVTVIPSCSDDSDCPGNQLCLYRHCRPSCGEDSQCASDARCVDTGRGSACARESDNACKRDADCPIKSRCNEDFCEECAGSADCRARADACDGGDCKQETSASVRSTRGASAPPEDPAGASAPPSSSSTAGANAAPSAPATAGASAGAAGTAAPSAPAQAPMTPSCPPGSALCDGMNVVACDARGTPQPERACAFACLDGACAGMCAPGARRCLGDLRQSCDATGAWKGIETCKDECSPDACIAACTEGERHCDGDRVMVCRGGAIVQDQQCPYVCRAGLCAGDCEPGTSLCSNNRLAVCTSDGAYVRGSECLNACVEDRCVGVCTPGAQRCGGASGYQRCTDEGQWSSTIACNGQTCIEGNCSGECSPGQVRCADARSVETCGSNGHWQAAVSCGSRTCAAGRCTGECQQGEMRCRGTSAIETCSASQTWELGPSCNGRICSGGACQGDCTPGSTRCHPSNLRVVQTCDQSARWADNRSCQESERCAESGRCLPLPCPTGQSPDWTSSASAGGDPSWTDSRWGSLRGQAFERVFASDAGGYNVVFDRAKNELAISLRLLLGSAQAPNAADHVYVGIASNRDGEPRARDVRIPLFTMNAGELGPRRVTAFETGTYSGGSWAVQQTGSASWFHDAAAWRGAGSDALSWAVALRIDLGAAGVDPALGFRMALRMHVDGLGDLSSPSDLPPAGDSPNSWSAVNAAAIQCSGRVSLGGNNP